MTADRHRRLTDLFLATYELPAPERSKLLDRECTDDPELRAEIDRLLARHDHDGALVDREPEAGTSLFAAATAVRPGALLLGRVLGGCRLTRVVAAGGMGVVYEAEQARPRRLVAVKVMRAVLASAAARRRFEYESQTLAKLRHPAIAQVFEAGTCEEGGGELPFFVMELIPGARPLTTYAREERLPLPRRLELFAAVCDAVHHGHQRGVIHRDLKPGNVLVDAAGAPKVIDFGVARSIDPDLAATTQHTEAGQLLGTLQYMSPEQCAGTADEVDVRSDVYALGVMLYELLCDHPPYEVAGVPLPEALRRVREAAPTRPSAHDRALKGDLETILAKALEKERSRRYQSAAALSDELRRVLRHEPIEAAPPGRWYRIGKYVRRHRVGVGAGAAVVVALLVGTGISVAGYVEARAGRGEALVSRDDAEATVDFLGSMLRAVSPGNLGKRATVRAAVDWVAKDVDRFCDRPRVEARVRGLLGSTYRDLGQFPEAETHLRRARDLRLALAGVADDSAADLGLQLADVLRFLGRLGEARALADELVVQSTAAFGADDPRTAMAVVTLGAVEIELDLSAEVVERMTAAHELLTRTRGPEHRDTLWAAERLGKCLYKLGRCRDALAVFEPLLAIRRREDGPTHPLTLLASNDVAAQLNRLERYAEAEELLTPAIDAMRRELGDDDDLFATALQHLATAQEEQGRPAEALPLFEEAHEFLKRVRGPTHPKTLDALDNLAGVNRTLGRLEESARWAEESLRGKESELGPTHPSTLRSASNLGSLYRDLGRLDEAEKLCRDALEQWRASGNGDHPHALLCANNLATICHQRGNFEEAGTLLSEVVAAYQRRSGESAEATLMATSNLALIRGEGGDLEQAETLLRRVVDLSRAKPGGEKSAFTLSVQGLLAQTLERRDRLDEARDLFEATLAGLRETRGPTHLATFSTACFTAALYVRMERFDDAAKLYEELYDFPPHPETPFMPGPRWIATQLAHLWEKLGDAEAAARWQARADAEEVPASEAPAGSDQ